jgi:putrescine aminotransferase
MASQTLSKTTSRWRDIDLRHHLHPFTDTRQLTEAGGSRIITKADGVWLEDSEGNKILDGMAGLWCVNLGYGRRELAETAYQQMLDLTYYNTFFQTATPPSVELADKLSALTPAGLDHVFYGCSGSEANDTLVRLVRYYWNLRGKPERKVFISRKNAYHGSTLAAASLSGMTTMHEQSDLPLPGFVHVDCPHWYDEGGDLSPEEFGLKAAKSLEDKILELGADKVAAFIGEPIMGAGGVLLPPDTYWPEVQRICRKHGVLLAADEVICGFGRTGQWFGSDLYDIKPDLMPMAKGLSSGYVPLSALMVSDEIAGVLIDKGGEFAHGYTYSGHPVCCAVALENIRILEDEKIVERVRDDTGPYFQRRLRETFADHPLVGEVRGVGLIAAIELVEDKKTRKHFEPVGKVGTRCRNLCFENGLVMRATRDAMVISPPLVISRDEIDEFMVRARLSVDQTAEELGKM